EVSIAVDRGIGGVALGDPELPFLLKDLADVFYRRSTVGVGHRDAVDVFLEDRRILTSEGIVDAAGAAGAEGEVGNEIFVTSGLGLFGGFFTIGFVVSIATAITVAIAAGCDGEQDCSRSECCKCSPDLHVHSSTSRSGGRPRPPIDWSGIPFRTFQV